MSPHLADLIIAGSDEGQQRPTSLVHRDLAFQGMWHNLIIILLVHTAAVDALSPDVVQGLYMHAWEDQSS